MKVLLLKFKHEEIWTSELCTIYLLLELILRSGTNTRLYIGQPLLYSQLSICAILTAVRYLCVAIQIFLSSWDFGFIGVKRSDNQVIQRKHRLSWSFFLIKTLTLRDINRNPLFYVTQLDCVDFHGSHHLEWGNQLCKNTVYCLEGHNVSSSKCLRTNFFHFSPVKSFFRTLKCIELSSRAK